MEEVEADEETGKGEDSSVSSCEGSSNESFKKAENKKID
jgi:hypothetical protein